MKMRKSIPLLLVTLLLVQSLMSITVQNVEATMGRGGSNDDYSVTEIFVNSTSASHWIQPDGTSILYVAKGDLVDISVEIKRGGSSLQAANATVMVEMVHPIGFVMNSTSWQTTPLLGSQSYTDSFQWEAFVAHSHLNVSTNELSGGVIIRASVMNPSDDRNENDVMEMELPVALSRDDMDAEGDPRDQALPAASIPTFYGGEFPPDGSDATGIGFGKKTTLHLLSAMQIGGIQTLVQTTLQHRGVDLSSHSEEQTITVATMPCWMVDCHSNTYSGCVKCN